MSGRAKRTTDFHCAKFRPILRMDLVARPILLVVMCGSDVGAYQLRGGANANYKVSAGYCLPQVVVTVVEVCF